ncbi:MAG: hypothetical protein GTO45_17185 [Candidatus Aminicenantes bacterium]|nr:hypothetical protein [Candidatus Aminicenantes bacterium]NIN19866.1 hypothetical protein [Candidatus Aminicenantes bacterium]NIN43742.1 hypothetical protein [Candidatus Aminicenantes bacterium]NIN86492.1 hypothetical protein [Candidatus Aminicenantes bacterium]NIR07336.1 hypothetical protein [Candidatus Aminicenantes bacterium]
MSGEHEVHPYIHPGSLCRGESCIRHYSEFRWFLLFSDNLSTFDLRAYSTLYARLSVAKKSPKNPNAPGKNRNVPAINPFVPIKNRDVPTKNPNVTGKNRNVPTINPFVPGKDRDVPTKDSNVPGKNS